MLGFPETTGPERVPIFISRIYTAMTTVETAAFG